MTKWSRDHRERLEQVAQKIHRNNPQLSLKKLTAEIRKENGQGANYATLSSIYRRLRGG